MVGSDTQSTTILLPTLLVSSKPIISTSRLQFLSRNRGTEDLRPEEPTLRALDDLLIDGHGRVVHDDRTGFVVDFGVDAGVADQVDDPFLAFV